jgi:hypothetical protein
MALESGPRSPPSPFSGRGGSGKEEGLSGKEEGLSGKEEGLSGKDPPKTGEGLVSLSLSSVLSVMEKRLFDARKAIS